MTGNSHSQQYKATTIGNSNEEVEQILVTKLWMSKVSVWWVPCLPMPDHKCTRMVISNEEFELWSRTTCFARTISYSRWVLGPSLWARDKDTINAKDAHILTSKKAMAVPSAGKVIGLYPNRTSNKHVESGSPNFIDESSDRTSMMVLKIMIQKYKNTEFQRKYKQHIRCERTMENCKELIENSATPNSTLGMSPKGHEWWK